MYLGDRMANIINFNDYREKNDPDYAISFLDKRKKYSKICKEESKNFKKAIGIKDIYFGAIGTLLVLGEVICTIGLGNALITNTWDDYHIYSLASTLGFFIIPGVLFVHKKEILDAYTNLCHKFKEYKKSISHEELDIFKEELEDIKERKHLEEQGFTMFDNNHRRR